MLKKTTLGKLQSELPIGIKIGSQYFRNFAFRDWLWEQEEEVAKLKEKGKTLGTFVREVLALMLIEIGNKTVNANNRKDIKSLLSRAYLADIFYMYIYLRYASLGQDLPINMVCANCNNPIKFTGDLEQLDVSYYSLSDDEESEEENIEDDVFMEAPIEDNSGEVVSKNSTMGGEISDIEAFINTLNYEVKLHRGITIGGEVYNKAIVHPCRWSLMDNMQSAEYDDAVMKKGMMKQSVIKLVGYDTKVFTLSDAMLKQMTKRDIETLVAKSTEINAGPDMTIEAVCSNAGCKFVNKIPVDWTYDNFFSLT